MPSGNIEATIHHRAPKQADTYRRRVNLLVAREQDLSASHTFQKDVIHTYRPTQAATRVVRHQSFDQEN